MEIFFNNKMRAKMIKSLIVVIIVLTIILGNFTITYYTNSKNEYKLEYNGLLWMTLDYWTIKKYKSSDKPMKLIKFTRNLKRNDKYKIV